METVIKAHGGNRAKNLEGIAEQIRKMLNTVEGLPPAPVGLTAQEVHRIDGYCEQLLIIADELAGKRK
jgi:hypothetical protein